MPITKLKMDLLGKLSVSQKQRSEGDGGKTLKRVMTGIRNLINTNK